MNYKDLSKESQEFVTRWLVDEFDIDPSESESWFGEMVEFLRYRGTKEDFELLQEFQEECLVAQTTREVFAEE